MREALPRSPCAFAIIYLAGSRQALWTIFAPILSYSDNWCSRIRSLDAAISANPPPSTYPSWIPALTANKLSSIRSLVSYISTSDNPPALIIQSPPLSFPIRSIRFSFSKSPRSKLSLLYSFSNWSIRSYIFWLLSSPLKTHDFASIFALLILPRM